MQPMSSAGKAIATNGRQTANTATTPTTNPTIINANIKVGKKPTTSTTTTAVAAPTNQTAIKSINNDNINVHSNNKLATTNTPAVTTTTTTQTSMKTPPRRDDSQQIQTEQRVSFSSTTTTAVVAPTTILQFQQHQQMGAHRRDALKYQYAKPQSLPITLLANNSLTTTANNNCSSPPITPTSSSDECDSNNVDSMLVYYEGQLISGKLESLIEHMVPTSDYYPTHNYIFAFLLSARLFVRPYELLAHVSNTWERQQQQKQSLSPINTDVVDETAKPSSTTGAMIKNTMVMNVGVGVGVTKQRSNTQKSAQNCIHLLSEWIETFPYDFRDERLMQQVRILARKCIYIDTSLGKQVSQILQLLVQRLTALEKYEEFLQTLNIVVCDQQQQQHFITSNATTTTITTTTTNTTMSNNTTPTITIPITTTMTATIGHLHNSHKLLHHYQREKQQQQQQQQNTINTQNEHKLYNNYNNMNTNYHDHHQSTHQLQQHSNLTQQQHVHQFATQQQHNATLSAAITTTTQINDVPNLVLGIMDICSSCAQLAHQLTAIELECLSHIGPEEFVQAFAKEYQQTKKHQQQPTSSSSHLKTNSNNSCSFNDMKKTRNLESYVEWFNRLSYLTATEIVKYSKKKQRVRVIEYWIETARECFNIGNFNSLMAIIAGLNLAPISRLKKTWSKVQSAKFSVLEHQMDPTSNFNSYRSTLKAAMWRFEGATDERERIIIPFFSLFVKDLYFLNEGCSNRLPNNHINFEKCSHLAKQVMDFNEWKQVSCPFEKLPNVIAFLQNSTVYNENTLSMASFECEPPENTEEKGRYKTVKAETKQQLLQQLQEQQHQQH